MSEISTLGDACSVIVDCAHKTAPVDSSGEYFAVGTPAMRGNLINYSAATRISRQTFEAWTERLRPREGDLLLAREAPVGPVVRIPKGENVAPGQRTVLLRPRQGAVDSDFLYYYLISPLLQAELQVKSAGSTVSHLNVADVRVLPTPGIPSFSKQHAIAEVLSALDDKIAANSREISLASKLAAAHFAKLAAETGFGGKTFADVAEVGGGGTPSTSVEEYWGGDVSWATPTDVTGLSAPYIRATNRRITESGLTACSSPLYPTGSILMTSRATIGAFAVAQVPMAVNQGFIVVNAKEPDFHWWLFHEMTARVSEFLANANGATFLELPRGRFKQLLVRLPERPKARAFADNVGPLHNLAARLVIENDRLAATRDELLPLLMSGRLHVKDAEQVVEAAL